MPKTATKTIRPVLLASPVTFSRYSMVLRRLLVGLADHSVAGALVCPPGTDLDPVVCGSIEVIRYPWLDVPGLGWLNRDRLLDQLDAFKPTVLHGLCETQTSLLSRMAGELECPYVQGVNSLQARATALRISPEWCARIVAPSGTILDNVRTQHGRLADRAERVAMGTFVGDRCACFSDPSEQPNLIMAHPVDRAEEFAAVFKAIRQLAQEGHEFMVVLMGQGRAGFAIHQMLVRMELTDRVTVIPELRPWRSVLAAGDLFIQPSPLPFFNPWLLEAMAEGLAVVACKGGVDDLIVDGHTALVFKQGDPGSIRAVLRQLLDNRDQARHIAGHAMCHIRDTYAVGSMVDQLIHIYRHAQDLKPTFHTPVKM